MNISPTNMPSLKTKLRLLGHNKRVWTFDDFESCCDVEQVEVVLTDSPILGAYTIVEDIPTIGLSDRVQGVRRLEVAFHELHHHYADVPCAFYSPHSEDKLEVAADRFALCAMIPRPLLVRMRKQYTLWDLYEEYGYGAELVNRRMHYNDLYGD
jgi:Zn-dependent peptidase ImmA (M78 family)